MKNNGWCKSIGLALSGGGYRAAAFHLGTLSYLNRVGLLERVNAISTVSGGTFTGTRLVLAQARGDSFQDYYRSFYDDLRDIDLIRLGLDALGDGARHRPPDPRDLIVAMAEVYASTFFKKGDGDTYRLGDILEEDIPIREATFNATDFRSGLAFRFQKTETGRIGNQYIDLPKADAADIRMADIVAASSCFPGGFEPLAFPDDFVWRGEKAPAGIRDAVAKNGESPIALMDGGIYDNQGISSLLLAEERRDMDLDLFVISDSDQPNDGLYHWPHDTDTIDVPLGRVRTILRLLKWGCVASGAAIAARLAAHYFAGDFGVFDWLLIIPLLLVAGTGYALSRAHRLIAGAARKHLPAGLDVWDDLKHLTVDQLLDMLILRGTSLVAMASNVFMHRIRELGYQLIYRDPQYSGQRVSNLIYHLATGAKWADLPGVEPPTAALHQVADVAATMPTALWFDKDVPQQQRKVVATGQATICYNLMKYIVRNCGPQPEDWPQEIKDLWARLTGDWDALRRDPCCFVDPEHVVPPAAPAAEG